MRLKKILCSGLFLFVLPYCSLTQVSIDWVARYSNGFSGNTGIAIITDDSGYVYVTGSSAENLAGRLNIVVLKYSSLGVNNWVRRVRDSINFESMIGNDIETDKFYNVFVCGTGVFKYDMNGNLLWNNITKDFYVSLVLDDSGNCYVTGRTDGGSSFITKKFSPEGVLRWEKTYQNLDLNIAEAIAIDKERNVLITGISSQTGTLYDFVTIKYSNNGDQIWLRRYNGGSDDIPYDIATDDSNNVYVTGWNSNNTVDILTIKYSSGGDTIWKAVYDGGGGDVGYDVEVDSLGFVYIGGVTFSNDYLTLKYNNGGNLIWSRTQIGNQIAPQHPVLKIDQSRNVYMSYVTLRTGNYANYAVVKYNNYGVQKWIAEYDYGSSSFNYIYDLALDNNFNVYVTGQSSGSMATVKFIQNPTLINQTSNSIPNRFKLEQNYPNPFNPVTNLEFGISELGFVSLKVYDVLGNEVATLVNEKKNAGNYKVQFNGNGLSSGIYFYRLLVSTPSGKTGSHIETRRMLLIK